MDKVPPERAFLDLSDYARPFARWLVRYLLPTPITPVQVTLAFTGVGLAAALLFAVQRALPLAGGLLLLKSLLDAADGALARARQRPSRVGRFLDSVCDFVVMAAVFLGIAIGNGAGLQDLVGAAGALLCATLQCSIFSYYYVRYRAESGGDTTSHIDESESAGYAWDDARLLRLLHTLYTLLYAWQDTLIDWLDRRLVPTSRPLRPAFLTATTVLGLGTQLLVIALCAFVGQPAWALGLFLTVFNVYAIGLLFARGALHA